MDLAQNYIRSASLFSKVTTPSILYEFKSFYKWEDTRDGEERTALDIGCGDGSVTTEIIKAFLPESTRLDGADISEDMINFAKNRYDKQGYKFFLWDLETEALDENLLNSYDHVFSMLCFHFVGNTKQALRNIYDILKPNGNFVFVFVPKMPHFHVLRRLSLNPKWSPYMQDVETVRPLPLADEKFPHKVIAELMSECGFKNVITKSDVKYILFDSMDVIEGQALYADPFRKRIPPELYKEYIADYVDALKQTEGFLVEKYNDKGESEGVIEIFNVMIGYGEKGSQ